MTRTNQVIHIVTVFMGVATGTLIGPVALHRLISGRG
jgi:hypothetical protein